MHDLLAGHPWVKTASWAYVRFHGPHADVDKYAGEYGAEGLLRPAQLLAGWRDEGCDVFAYFNNDADGAAVRDASLLAGRLTSG